MSGDIFTTLSEKSADTKTEDTKYKFGRVNIYDGLKRCSYEGDCKWRHSLKNKESLCSICKYKIQLDIPALLDEKIEKKFGKNEKSKNKEIKIKKYVKKIWLNPKDSASTGSIVVFDGPYKYKSDMEEIRDSFVEIKDCSNGIRLHRTFEDSEQNFINKVKILRDVLTDFIKHLNSIKKEKEF